MEGILFLTALCAVLAVLIAVPVILVNRQSEAAARRRALMEEADDEIRNNWAEAAEALMASLPEEGADEALIELARDWGALDEVWKARKNEPVLGVMPVSRIDDVTVVSNNVGFSGFTVSQKIVGPIRFRAGQMKVARTRTTSRKSVATGVLIITKKRLHFAPLTGKGWSKTWGSIANWQPTDKGVVITPNNGKVVEFAGATDRVNEPKAHPLFLIGVMDYASGTLDA